MIRCRSDTELLEHFTKRLPENQDGAADGRVIISVR